MGTSPTPKCIIGQFVNQRGATDDFLQLASSKGGNVFAWIDSDGTLRGTFATDALAAGADTQVQINSNGALYADAGFTYNKTTSNVIIAGSLNLSGTTKSFQIGGTPILGSPVPGNGNTFVGLQALQSIVVASQNTAVGFQALKSLTTGGANTAIGNQVATFLTTGQNNIGIGTGALGLIVSSSDNVAIGLDALEQCISSSNIAIGTDSLQGITTGSQNIGIGYLAFGTSSGTAANNTGVGYQVGHGLSTGTDNTLFGHQAGIGITTGNFNIVLGEDTAGSITTGSSNIAIGNNLASLTATLSNQLDIGDVILGTGLDVPSTAAITIVGSILDLPARVRLGFVANSVSSILTFQGQSTGSCSIQAAPNAGSPNALALPTATPVTGQLMTGASGSPAAMIWATGAFTKAQVDLTAQGAAITTTNLLASATAGQFRLNWNAKVTTVDGSSSTLGALTIVYTDPDSVVQTIVCPAAKADGSIATTNTGNVTTSVLLGLPLLLNCKAGTAITYAFAYVSNTPGQMKYNLHINLETFVG